MWISGDRFSRLLNRISGVEEREERTRMQVESLASKLEYFMKGYRSQLIVSRKQDIEHKYTACQDAIHASFMGVPVELIKALTPNDIENIRIRSKMNALLKQCNDLLI
jgi:hypothetical protein